MAVLRLERRCFAHGAPADRERVGRMIGLLTVSLLGAASLGAQPAVAMFRGDPAHSGVYVGGGPTIVGMQWRVATGGDVIASPAVLGNRVYVGSGDGKLYALDLTSGRQHWAYAAGSPVASSPAVGGGRVFAETRDGRILAVDQESGTLRWQFATGPTMPFPWGHESGDTYLSSPVYVNGVVLVGAGDGKLYALDGTSGRVRWSAQTGGRVRASPAVAGNRVYVGSFDGRVYAFDLITGRQLWRFDTEGAALESGKFGFDRRSIQSSPAVANGTVFVGARDGFLYALRSETGTLLWRYDHKISWVNSSPAVAEGVVYAGSSDGHFVQAVDAVTGRELWRTDVDAVVWSSPAVAGGQLYVGDGAGRLHVMDRRSGRDLATIRTGSGIFSSPVVAGDLVIVGSTDDGVYAVRVGDGNPVDRAVFFDSSYVRAATVGQPAALAQYLANRGYETVDVRGLTGFLKARIADRAPSVVVFAIDALPADAGNGRPALLRQYLDAGGKVVWCGLPPLLWPADLATGERPGLIGISWNAPAELLGVPHDRAIFDARGVRATDDGQRWGLPARWRASWGVAPSGVTRVLGLDEWGLASAWVRNYGGPEGTGFVRVPDESPLAVYLAAEYRPRTP
jgi:outer membrane protein assembly factor BamB